MFTAPKSPVAKVESVSSTTTLPASMPTLASRPSRGVIQIPRAPRVYGAVGVFLVVQSECQV